MPRLTRRIARRLTRKVTRGLAGSPGGGDVDFRLAWLGIQASFYRLDDTAAGSNVVTADGGTTCQSLLDVIPQINKTVPAAPYIVSAPAPSQRPALGANGTLVCDETALEHLIGAAGLATVLSAVPVTAYSVWRSNPASTSTANATFSVGATSGSYWVLRTPPGSGTRDQRRVGGGNQISAFATGETGFVIDVGIGSATQGVIMQNGVLGAPVVAASAPVLDGGLVALGAYYRGSAGYVANYYLGGTLCEVTFCLGAHSEATAQAYSAELLAYWTGRGVAF